MEPTRSAGPQAGQATQGAQSAQSSRAKVAAQRAGEPVDSSAQGGFLALLASLETETTLPDNGLPLQMAVDNSAADKATSLVGTDPAALAAWQGLLPPGSMPAGMAVVTDPAALAAWQGLLPPGSRPVGMAAVSVTAAVVPAAADGVGSLPGLSRGAGSEWLPVPDGLVAQTATLDGAAEAADATGVTPHRGTVAGYGRGGARLQNALSQAGGVSGALAAATADVVKAEKKQAFVMAAAAAQLSQPGVDARAIAAPGTDAGSRGGGDLSGAWGGATALPALEALAESRVPQRSSSAAGGESGGRSPANAAGSDWGLATASPPVAGVEGAADFANSAQLGAEEQIADQVAYWVNQKTQNAEMTLDRDGQPVQVTVSLSGSEAHVTFRSDQAQTRELLDSSMAQLRDLLHNEGLVLAGTTVGTTARDGASPNDSGQRQGRGGERRAQVVTSVPSAAVTARHNGGASDRAVDIFV